jgi:hypothetical protein
MDNLLRPAASIFLHIADGKNSGILLAQKHFQVAGDPVAPGTDKAHCDLVARRVGSKEARRRTDRQHRRSGGCRSKIQEVAAGQRRVVILHGVDFAR